MNNGAGGLSCVMTCWLISLLGGILLAALLMLLAGFSFIASVFFGLVALVLGGLLLSWAFCKGLPGPNEANTYSSQTGADARTAQADMSGSAQASDASGAATATAATAAAATAAAATSAATSDVNPSARLSGEEELAERKGEWKYDGASSDDGEAARAKAAADAEAARAKAAADAQAKADADAAAAKANADAEAARKQADADAAAAKARADADAARAEADAKAKADAQASASGDVDYDGDGVIEGTNEGTRPAALDGPRGGKADDLKQIKGVGPKMEKMCNSLGFYHFDQIANWSKDEVAWVDANLEGFKGRVTRDTWVEQAGVLAAGGETAFSKKVEDGGVYDK